jgi:hypothetical protein
MHWRARRFALATLRRTRPVSSEVQSAMPACVRAPTHHWPGSRCCRYLTENRDCKGYPASCRHAHVCQPGKHTIRGETGGPWKERIACFPHKLTMLCRIWRRPVEFPHRVDQQAAAQPPLLYRQVSRTRRRPLLRRRHRRRRNCPLQSRFPDWCAAHSMPVRHRSRKPAAAQRRSPRH